MVEWNKPVGATISALLMILYIGVFVIACIRRVTPRMTFWQITFVLFLSIGSLLRTVNWCIKLLQSVEVEVNLTQRATFYLSESPEPFMLGAYLDLLLLWACVYDSIQYEFSGDIEIKYRVLLITLVVFDFAVFMTFCLVDLKLYPTELDNRLDVVNACQESLILFNGICYLLVGIGFAYKGFRFHYFFKTSDTTMPLYYEYAKKQQEENILPRIKYITFICVLCFSIRGILVIARAVISIPSNVYLFIQLPFWALVEILPLALMLFILKKPKSNDEQPLMMNT